MVLVVEMHGGTITKVKEQSRSEPLEGLASLFSSAGFHIQSMSNGHKVHDEDGMVNGVEDLVGNGIPKVRGESNYQQESQDAVSRNHDFFGEFFAKGLLSVRAEKSEEGKEENDGPKDNDDHGVSEVNVHAKASIEGYDIVDEGIAQATDCIACHSQWNECHLKENGVHGSKFERGCNDFPPVSVGSLWNGSELGIELSKGKVG